MQRLIKTIPREVSILADLVRKARPLPVTVNTRRGFRATIYSLQLKSGIVSCWAQAVQLNVNSLLKFLRNRFRVNLAFV